MTLEGDPATNELTHTIIGGAIEVHRALGPGLLESAYQACLLHELEALKLHVERRKPVSLVYKGLNVEEAYFADIVVNGLVVVELKCVEVVTPVHEAQLLTYLRLTGCSVGLILNFKTAVLKDGIVRKLNSGASSRIRASGDRGGKCNHGGAEARR